VQAGYSVLRVTSTATAAQNLVAVSTATLITLPLLLLLLLVLLLLLLQKAGIKLTQCELMTGLPEYRNGGLLIDLGLLQPKYPEVVRFTSTTCTCNCTHLHFELWPHAFNQLIS
jgi:Protein of unknown function (DUF1688)